MPCLEAAHVAGFGRTSDTGLEPRKYMSRLMIALFVAAGLGVAGSAAAQMSSPMPASAPMTKDAHTLATTNADAQYKIDKDACSSLHGNGKDICVAQAKGKDSIAKAD